MRKNYELVLVKPVEYNEETYTLFVEFVDGLDTSEMDFDFREDISHWNQQRYDTILEFYYNNDQDFPRYLYLGDERFNPADVYIEFTNGDYEYSHITDNVEFFDFIKERQEDLEWVYDEMYKLGDKYGIFGRVLTDVVECCGDSGQMDDSLFQNQMQAPEVLEELIKVYETLDIDYTLNGFLESLLDWFKETKYDVDYDILRYVTDYTELVNEWLDTIDDETD